MAWVVVLAVGLSVLVGCGTVKVQTQPVTLVADEDIAWPDQYPGWVLIRESAYMRLIEDLNVLRMKERLIYESDGKAIPE